MFPCMIELHAVQHVFQEYKTASKKNIKNISNCVQNNLFFVKNCRVAWNVLSKILRCSALEF